jgi:hypothetical protein
MSTTVVLLGPQRFEPHVRETIDTLGVQGRVAVVTAGWQERESEDDELREHLGRDVDDLLLYHRYEDVLRRDRPLARALEERQEALKRVQRLYRLRLGHLLDAARELFGGEEPGPWLEEHRHEAIHALRTLDRQHLRRLRALHEAFERRHRPLERPLVARQVAQLEALIRGAGALCIAGGHVAVLLNRLRIFGIERLLGARPVVAWSAGAMAVTERVVLFHDSPPQGPGDPEVLDAGLAWCRGVVALPHAARRLRLADPVRCALFARRFAPATCVVLDNPACLTWDGASWSARAGTKRIARSGRLLPLVRPSE